MFCNNFSYKPPMRWWGEWRKKRSPWRGIEPRTVIYICKHCLHLSFRPSFVNCLYLISDSMFLLVTMLVNYSSTSDIFLFGGERHLMFVTQQKCCHQLQEWHRVLWFIISWRKPCFHIHMTLMLSSGKNRAISTMYLLCCEVVTKASCISHSAKMFSADCGTHASFCQMGEQLPDGCRGHGIVITLSNRGLVFEQKT